MYGSKSFVCERCCNRNIGLEVTPVSDAEWLVTYHMYTELKLIGMKSRKWPSMEVFISTYMHLKLICLYLVSVLFILSTYRLLKPQKVCIVSHHANKGLHIWLRDSRCRMSYQVRPQDVKLNYVNLSSFYSVFLYLR